MGKHKLNLIFGLFFIVLTSCKTTQTSMIIGDNYDEKTNKTTLTLLPYGNVVLPDKWTKTDYNQSSRQHFFQNTDTTTVGVAKNPKEKYPFFKGNQADYEFVIEFVKWDTDYWKKQGVKVITIEEKSEKGYILWQAIHEEKDINMIFLFGAKSGLAYNLSGTSKNWTEEKIKDFLVDLYLNN
jgi:hypothetical protein